MNQKQREFLIEKIKKEYGNKIEAVRKSVPDKPDLERFVVAAALTGSLEIQDPNVIAKHLEETIENMKTGDTVTKPKYRGYNSWVNDDDIDRNIELPVSSVIKIPKRFQDKMDNWRSINKESLDKIHLLETERDGLVMRVNLATNQVLDNVIREVDDMGELSLFDTKLQIALSGTDEPKKLES